MTSITIEKPLAVSAEAAWALLRRTDAAHEAFPGVLSACEQEGDTRTVTFVAGMAARERIVGVDEAGRRIAYGVIEGPFSHHSAAMRVVEDGPGRSRLVWTSDFLPDALEAMVRPLMEQGGEAFRRAVER
jgi:carbon monoxide dehydrogenase subunit G